MTYAISRKATAGLLVMLTLMGLLTLRGFANAQAAQTCLVRSDVSAAEAQDLLDDPSATGAVSGTRLPLTDPTGAGSGPAGNNALICTYAMVKFVTNLLFFAIIAVSVLLIAWAAFTFVTAGSNPGKRTQARSFLIFAIVGLIVAAVARVIPAVVRGVIGV